ncbi:SURF1-like protein [Sulfidibacter corallicola]|uniref:SURF1-like protein n=1 Tax=Sulfidibacter corallicola TaxID=2818388 RepID=A0A8A4TEE1_SULCO|nr:SURF1 family protein [Sulfidibacter corallicola]QTD47927.1 SURF1 family protein [Sulfidibacter corallicola]
MIGYFRGREFSFSLETTVLALLAAMLCGSMSYWQWTRYHGKKAYLAELARQEARGPLRLSDADGDWASLHHATVRVSGTFDYEREMVLINRSHRDQAGVKVVTPLQIQEGETPEGQAWILVDRGFVPYEWYATDTEHARYRPQGRQTLTALVRPAQDKAFFLAPSTKAPLEGEWKERWLRLEVDKMATQLPYEVLPIFLEASEERGEGVYPVPLAHDVLPPSRHLNYTLQWLSFGCFGLFLGVLIQFRRVPVREKASQESETFS